MSEDTDTKVKRWLDVLEHHKCWSHPEWSRILQMTVPVDTAGRIEAVEIAVHDPEPYSLSTYNIVRAAILDVESGAVFGDGDRCCVCGRSADGARRIIAEGHWRAVPFWRCGGDTLAYHACDNAIQHAWNERKAKLGIEFVGFDGTTFTRDDLAWIVIRAKAIRKERQGQQSILASPTPEPKPWVVPPIMAGSNRPTCTDKATNRLDQPPPGMPTVTPATCRACGSIAVAAKVEDHWFCKTHLPEAQAWYARQDELAERARHELDRPVHVVERQLGTGDLYGPSLDPRKTSTAVIVVDRRTR